MGHYFKNKQDSASSRTTEGIEMTEFRDGPPIEWIAQQLDLEEGIGVEPSSEDLELKFEEVQDQRDWLSDDENEGSEPEDPEYAQLREEEQQALLEEIRSDDDW